jgi:glycine dehydrogenase
MKLHDYTENFTTRHIGIRGEDLPKMLQTIGVSNLNDLIDQTVPENIRMTGELDLPEAMTESDYLAYTAEVAGKNKVNKCYIGMGYYPVLTPNPILRNLFQNPGWYTQYTPYQAEISQGRLESLLNFQTMVSDLTGLPISNASLLDEATAGAESMNMFYEARNKRSEEYNIFYVDEKVYPQTYDVIATRCHSVGVELRKFDWTKDEVDDKAIGVLIQYPDMNGCIHDYRAWVAGLKSRGIYIAVATDLMALAVLTPPGEWGADVVFGNSQRFGVPIGFGGPHAAFFSTTDEFKRAIPGRIIGVSIDVHGNRALRMALQTREQHIKREKATSNICTAQALLANMAAMYAVYHGPEGIKNIAQRIHLRAVQLSDALNQSGFKTEYSQFFDTVYINLPKDKIESIVKNGYANGINFGSDSNGIRIAMNETTSVADINNILRCFEISTLINTETTHDSPVSADLLRTSDFMTHPVFNTYHSESQLMRYLKRLENKDLSLVHSMISLGSCTMKLNAAAEMIPVTYPEFANIHPMAPADQWEGYKQIIDELSQYLCEITGFAACSLQPNSGAQGEYAGLVTIKAYLDNNGKSNRNIALIPSSAHGTNPASAVMAGMKVVVVKTDDQGNIDFEDLKRLADEHADNLACLMVTYPSTFGVFELSISDICDYIHQKGGLVYMDGANMNAQVGLTNPGVIGADVCHLNLHKTFAIPHGGGGPGMGPICCTQQLADYLPGHIWTNGKPAVSAAPFGSASILLISYGYIRMLGKTGVKNATEYAILNANYIKARLEKRFSILYTGAKGRAAHEMIIDLRPYKHVVSAEDVAKRLMDYGFHAPTLSFPVAGTLMIEPTESEDKPELDRFCDAMLSILDEIEALGEGGVVKENNVLANAPHALHIVTSDNWAYGYSREKAAYPLPYLHEGHKFWVNVGRVDNAYGDRNLVCSCPPIEDYMS